MGVFNMETLSNRLKKLRSEKNFSINEVAKKIGVSPSTYRTWENGAEIRGEPYLKIANVFEISLSELITGEQNNLEAHLNEIERIIGHIRVNL